MSHHQYWHDKVAESDRQPWRILGKRDRFDRAAEQIVRHPHVKKILDASNQDYTSFAILIATVMRDSGVGDLPQSVQEALNSGDGVYRP